MLLTKEDEVRICDFGWSAEVQIEKALLTTCGTPHYWSPEIFEGCRQYTAVDLWALGTLVYELLVGHAPFWGTVEEIRKKVLAVDLRYPPNLLSNEAIQLFYCLLQKEPRSRVPAHQLLAEHPWVRRGMDATAVGQGGADCQDPRGQINQATLSVKGPVIAPAIRPPEGSQRSAAPLSAALPSSLVYSQAPAAVQSSERAANQAFLNATSSKKTLPTLPSLMLHELAPSLPPPQSLQAQQRLVATVTEGAVLTGNYAALGTAR